MRLIFMGTPEFSVAFLRHLHASSHEVIAVVTQPDRPAGRGRHLQPSPVKQAALEFGLPVLQPTSLKDPSFEQEVRELNADLSVVVAFSILPKSILGATRLGAVNLHGSLLPRYRGAAPVQWAVANGEHKTGLTVFLLDEKMDHGPLLVQERIEIHVDDTGHDVLMHMVPLGCDALTKALDGLEAGTIEPLHQDHAEASPAPKLRKEDGCLDWTKSAHTLHDRIRGFQPWPGGFSYVRGKLFHIHKSHAVAETTHLAPGELLVENGSLLVGTGQGALELITVQFEGKKPMAAKEFLNGLHDPKGLFLSRTP